MGTLYNKKFSKCIICDRKHYALGYCREHWNRVREGRQLQPATCKFKNCNKKVYKHIEKQVCAYHYATYLKSLIPPRYKNDGGNWGYKDYRKYKQLKKKQCELCNRTKNLVLHHKDKNTRNPVPTNLITVCQKCHVIYFHNVFGKKNTSKYKRKYGFTCQELLDKCKLSMYAFNKLQKKGKLKNFLMKKKIVESC